MNTINKLILGSLVTTGVATVTFNSQNLSNSWEAVKSLSSQVEMFSNNETDLIEKYYDLKQEAEEIIQEKNMDIENLTNLLENNNENTTDNEDITNNEDVEDDETNLDDEELIKQKDKKINELSKNIENMQIQLENSNSKIMEKDKIIKELESKIEELKSNTNSSDNEIGDVDADG